MGDRMAPPLSDQCVHCQAPVADLFAEWTDEWQDPAGKPAILAGAVVFDCPYCQGPLQLVLPLAIRSPLQPGGSYRVAKRTRKRCEDWLTAQHPGRSLSEVIEAYGMDHNGAWAFDGYRWGDGGAHRHGHDTPP
jgi:hypothetical protein